MWKNLGSFFVNVRILIRVNDAFCGSYWYFKNKKYVLYTLNTIYGYNNSKFKYNFDIWSYISFVNIIRTIGYMKYNMKDRGWTTLSILCLNGLFWCQVTFSRQDVSNEIKHCIRLVIFMCIFVANSSQLHSKVIHLIECQTNFTIVTLCVAIRTFKLLNI